MTRSTSARRSVPQRTQSGTFKSAAREQIASICRRSLIQSPPAPPRGSAARRAALRPPNAQDRPRACRTLGIDAADAGKLVRPGPHGGGRIAAIPAIVDDMHDHGSLDAVRVINSSSVPGSASLGRRLHFSSAGQGNWGSCFQTWTWESTIISFSGLRPSTVFPAPLQRPRPRRTRATASARCGARANDRCRPDWASRFNCLGNSNSPAANITAFPAGNTQAAAQSVSRRRIDA